MNADRTLQAVRSSLQARALPFPIRVKRVSRGTLAFEVRSKLSDGSGTLVCHQWGFEEPVDLVTLASEELRVALDRATGHANQCEHQGLVLA